MGTHINPRTAKYKPPKRQHDPPSQTTTAVPANVLKMRALLAQMRKKK